MAIPDTNTTRRLSRVTTRQRPLMKQVPSGFRTSGKRSSPDVLAITGETTRRPKKRTGLGPPPSRFRSRKILGKMRNRGSYVRSSGLVIEYNTVCRQILKVLASHEHLTKDPNAVLEEIIERSGLLLAVDNVANEYQFAHLTLQEFLAAESLKDDCTAFLERFKRDPDASRETAKIWTGLANDGTRLVRELRILDPALAFECLAAAKNVAKELADEMVTAFRSRLSEGKGNEAITRSFASVASNDTDIGRSVLAFLQSELSSKDNPAQFAVA